MSYFQRQLRNQTAKLIDKPTFLAALKAEWSLQIGPNADIDRELEAARRRIKKSGFESAYKIAGITDADFRQVIEEIVKSRALQQGAPKTDSL